MKPQWILAVDHGYVRDWARMEPGYNPASMVQFLHGPISLKRGGQTQVALGRMALRQRESLEDDENWLQILPYTVITKKTSNGREFAKYTRMKGGGEARLEGNTSLGWGGHPDRDMLMWNEDGGLNFRRSITSIIRTELSQECRFYTYLSDGTTKQSISIYDMIDAEGDSLLGDAVSLLHYGFIYDRSNPVGRVHLAVVSVLEVPEEVFVESGEAELRFDAMLTAPELALDTSDWENWTKLIISAVKEGIWAPNDPKLKKPVDYRPAEEVPPVDELARRIEEPRP